MASLSLSVSVVSFVWPPHKQVSKWSRPATPILPTSASVCFVAFYPRARLPSARSAQAHPPPPPHTGIRKLKAERQRTSSERRLAPSSVKIFKMPFHGSIVVIKRSGADGSVFPLVNSACLLGRAEGCDIRVQLPTVAKEHCRVSVVPGGKEVSEITDLRRDRLTSPAHPTYR